jgi:hypothetical protein
MGKRISIFSGAMLKRWVITAVILFGIFFRTDAQALTIHVVDDDGNPVTNGFRWLVMHDDSYHVTPGQPNPTAGDPESFTLGVNIHHSGAGDPQDNGDTSPDQGRTVSTALATAVSKVNKDARYHVSVLPWHSSPAGTAAFRQSGWTMSGRTVEKGQTDVTIVVHKFPVPTAQLTILVFEDTQPTNAAFDTTQEHGLGGFDILISDTVGKVLQDVWGNPLGTTYRYKCSAPDANGVKIPLDCKTNLPLGAETQPEYLTDPITGVPVVDFKGTGVMTSCFGDTPAHPFPSAWMPNEMANCVDPYSGLPMATGEAVVRYLPQNHYLIEPIPPANDPDWIGPTNTTEGGRAQDNWPKAGEPRFDETQGVLGYSTFEGFVKACNNGPTGLAAAAPTATNPTGTTCHGLTTATTPPPVTPPGFYAATIQGQIVQTHDQHPPFPSGLNPGIRVPDCFVALNNLSGADEMVYAGACNADSSFQILGVPPGTYQLAMWDKAINYVIDYRTIVVPSIPTGQPLPAGTVLSNNQIVIDMGMVPLFKWFGTYMGKVFNDSRNAPNNKNSVGKPWFDDGSLKPGIANMLVNLRFTDGTVAFKGLSDSQGNFNFVQFFPFWRFLIAEIGPDRFKPTGMTAVADDGGEIQAPRTCSNTIALFCSADSDCPTGETCTGAFLRFGQHFTGNAGQTYPGTLAPYGMMGINPQVQTDGQLFRTESGLVRTEAVGPFIQDMTVRIDWGLDDFQKSENGSVTGVVYYDLTRTDEDPAKSIQDGWEPGVPGIQVNLYKDLTGTGALLPGQLPYKTTTTTSWNNTKVSGCVSQPGTLWGSPQVVNGVAIPDCAETFKTWVQIRPAPYDGFYAFDDIPTGKYIVEIKPPSEYRITFWGDRDIEFGDPKIPFLEPPVECVGDQTPVPQYHTLFPDQQVPTVFPGGWSPGLTAPFCDRKYADLTQQRSFVTNFGIFTDVPIPSRIWGTVWNDLFLEMNPSSPNAGGNLALSWVPVAVKDFKGQTLVRTYTDQWGHFEAMAPSNYDISPPIPIGLVVPQYPVIANDPGPILDTRPGSPTAGQLITDPFYNPAYGQIVAKTNWPFLAGQTTFVDNPVLPTSAFVGNRVPLNCDFSDHSPEIFRVDGPKGGPIVFESGPGAEQITILSVGQLTVNNPDYNPNLPTSGTNPLTIVRDHGFGAVPGSVTVTYKDSKTAVTVTVAAAGAAQGATSIPVVALSGPIPAGTTIDFGAGKFARLIEAALKGAIKLTVAPLINPLSVANPANIPPNSPDVATYAGTDIITPLVGLQWAVDGRTISATVPSGIKTGLLLVTRGDTGKTTTVGVTLHVNDPRIAVHRVSPPPPGCLSDVGGVTVSVTTTNGATVAKSCRPIQDAIDGVIDGDPTHRTAATRPGDLILIAPGRYQENLIMWKPVQLQGYGAESTVIDNTLAAGNFPLQAFQFAEILALQLSGDIGFLPGVGNDFVLEQGIGITVAGCVPAANPYFPAFPFLGPPPCPSYTTPGNPVPYTNYFGQPLPAPPLIDGLTITGSIAGGGGVLVHGFANNFKISNCEIFANQGSIHGGIRFGNSSNADDTNPAGSSFNPSQVVDHNRISQNGSLFSGGGGIAIYTGTDNYRVTNNFICGNFSAQYGGGIGHFGLSNNGLIAHNQIVSNESFDEGGGMHIAGEVVPATNNFTDPTLVIPQFSALNAGNPQTLSLGAGSVIINDNLIQGNKGGDDGGGIRTLQYNGEDVRQHPADPAQWHEIDIFNNMIVNNASADHGGGLSFDDTVKSFVVNNTIANNDSTSTAAGAFGMIVCNPVLDAAGQFCPNISLLGESGGFTTSIPQVGGIASFAHGTPLNNALQAGAYCAPAGIHINENICSSFANPLLLDNIIWHNRSFYWDSTINNNLGGLVQIPVRNGYWDMTVYGMPTSTLLNPTFSILTDGVGATPAATNLLGTTPVIDPRFTTQCDQPFVDSLCQGFNIYKATMKGSALGNYVATTFTPNGLRGDYHTGAGSSATDKGSLFAAASPVFTGDQQLLATDFDGKPRPLGAAADIGANEQLALTTNFPVIQVLQPASLALDFGTVPLFQPVQRTVKIINYSQVNLIVAGASTNSPQFSVISWTGLTTLAPGATMNITVAYTPVLTTAAPQPAILTIVSNATQNQIVTVALQGNGF